MCGSFPFAGLPHEIWMGTLCSRSSYDRVSWLLFHAVGGQKLVESEELASLIGAYADKEGTLSDEAIASLCTKLDLDRQLVQKWKTDKLDKK